MNINLKYDLSKNIGSAKKVKGETDYYVGVSKICPCCYTAIVGYPAISRKDNKTEICSECGTLEAVREVIEYNRRGYVLNKFDIEKITNEFEIGDIYGLDEIQKQIKDNNITGEIQDLLTCVYKLNYILIETEQESYAAKYNSAVQDIYSEMKSDLFEMLEIKK